MSVLDFISGSNITILKNNGQLTISGKNPLQIKEIMKTNKNAHVHVYAIL